MYYFEAVKNVLGVKTNRKDFSWAFGTAMPCTEQEVFDKCRIKLEVIIDDFDLPEDMNHLQSYHFFKNLPEDHGLLYVRDFLFGQTLKWKLMNGHTSYPTVVINKTYYKYVKYRIMNLHSVRDLLSDLAVFLLLREGMAPVYGAAFNYNGKTSLTFAPPNTGKTVTSLKACQEYGAKYVAEDMAVTDGELIYAVPWTCSFRQAAGHASWLYTKVKKLFAVEDLFNISAPALIQSLKRENRILHQSICRHVFILEKSSSTFISDEHPETIYKKVENLNRYGFYYVKSPLLMAYTYFNPGFTLNEACSVETEVLRKLVMNAEKTVVVSDDEACNYMELIREGMADEQTPQIS